MALTGHMFSLSAGGSWISQRELGEMIKLNGGGVSNIVHKRVRHVPATGRRIAYQTNAPTVLQVDFLVASAQAVKRDTQAQTARDTTRHLVAPVLTYG